MWRRILLVLAYGFFIFSSEAQNSEGEVKHYMEKGEEYNEKGEYEAAFENFIRASVLSHQLDSSHAYFLDMNILLGDFLNEAGLVKEAIARCKETLLLIRRHHPSKKYEYMYTMAKLGGWYQELGEYDSSLHYARENLLVASNLGSNSLASQYNNTGMVFDKLNWRDSALVYYQKALALLDAHKDTDSNLIYSILDNIGENYFHQKEFGQAEEYFTRCYQMSQRRLINPWRKLQSCIQMGRVYTARTNYTKAEESLNEAEKEIVLREGPRKTGYRVKLNQAWNQLYRNTGRYKEALEYQEATTLIQDSLTKANSRKRNAIMDLLISKHLGRVNLELMLEQEKSKSQAQQLKISRNRSRFLIAIALIVAIFSTGIILVGRLYFRTRQKRIEATAETLEIRNRLNEAELKNRKLEEERLKQELDHKRQDISDLALYVSNLRNLHDIMLSDLDELKKMDPSEQVGALKVMIADLSNRLDLSQKTSLIHAHIEELNHEFYSRLSQKHPILTKIDWELCGLIRLNMDNKEIAALKSIEPDSVKRSKNRLRQKLQLPPETDIRSYLKNL